MAFNPPCENGVGCDHMGKALPEQSGGPYPHKRSTAFGQAVQFRQEVIRPRVEQEYIGRGLTRTIKW